MIGRSSKVGVLFLGVLAGILTAGADPRAGHPGTRPGERPAQADSGGILSRAAERLESFYERAHRILATETVHIQPLASDFSREGFGRRLIYELRTEWPGDDPASAAEPKVLRKLLLVDGRAPDPGDEPECMDPDGVSEDPLALLLPSQRGDFAFSAGGSGRVRGRATSVLEFRARPIEKDKRPEATWDEDCASIPLDGYVRGSIHVDAESGDVLRLEQHLVGPVDVRPPDRPHDTGIWRVLERWDQFIDYKAVKFSDPEETAMVPASIETLSVFRGRGVSRVRITQTFSDHKRFVAESRIVR